MIAGDIHAPVSRIVAGSPADIGRLEVVVYEAGRRYFTAANSTPFDRDRVPRVPS
jgi:hypothetical protein